MIPLRKRILGPRPMQVERHRWRNWAGNREALAEVYFEPRTKGEIQQIVRRAKNEGRRVRVVGNSYSWSPLIGDTDAPKSRADFLVCLKRMADLVHFRPYRADGVFEASVTVECGMDLGTLTDVVEAGGFALRSPTVIPFLSIGGLIGVGAHGSDTEHPPFPDHIRRFWFIDADGNDRQADEQDVELIRSLRANLGALGIIYQVELRAVEDFTVRVINEVKPRMEAFDSLEQKGQDNPHMSVFWFPYTEKALVRTYEKTPGLRPTRTLSQRFIKRAAKLFLQKWGGPPGLVAVTKFAPSLVPFFMRQFAFRLFQIQGGNRQVERSAEAFHYVLNYPRLHDMSFAVDAHLADDAWRYFVSKANEYAARNKFPLTLLAHSRQVAPSTTYLSPAVGRQTAYVEVLAYHGTRGWQEFFQDVELGFYERFPGARPHWGKHFWAFDRIRDAYDRPTAAMQRGEAPALNSMSKFLDVRQELDPDGRFLTPWLRRVFQIE
jgi:hypothetical protein